MRTPKVILTMGALVLAGALVAGEGCTPHAAQPGSPASRTTAPSLEPTTAPAVEVVLFTPPATLPATAAATLPTATRPAATHPVVVVVPASLPSSMPSIAVSTTSAATGPATSPATAPATTRAVTSAPADIASVFTAQMRRVLAGEEIEPTALAGLPLEDRQAIKTVLQGFAKSLSQLREAGLPSAAVALVEMADRIRNLTPLQITSVALCTRVDGFGVYEEMVPEFRAMTTSNVVLYCELSGFTSRTGDRALWETRVLQDVSLVDEKGEVLWQDKPNTMVDTCRSFRRDFYLARVVRLPDNIPAGAYHLKVQVTDQLSNESANAAVAVTYVAKP